MTRPLEQITEIEPNDGLVLGDEDPERLGIFRHRVARLACHPRALFGVRLKP
jgi:hypothetical protein